MDLRGLGAFLTAIGSIFSAKAGAKAGQLQGLLMGEDITERRKRMKMAEEAHQLQTELLRAEERRKAELFPTEKALREEELRRRQEFFPLEKEALATKVEAGKLNLEDTRLWTLFRQGVAPSQISDPVLRARYEPFFNYQMAVRSLEAVETREDLDAILGQVPEEFRSTLEIMGRMHLFTNQSRRQMIERQMRGMDTNIAQGEFNLRTSKLNYAITVILNNINNEGMDWDKRSPQQKIEAVKKWIKQLGLEDVVPEDFANMFQRVKPADARQFALYRAQAELQHRMQRDLMAQQFGYNLNLQRESAMTNLLYGALQGGGQGGVAPLGFPATDMPPAPLVFNPTPDNQNNYLNQTALNNYLKAPADIAVPVRVGNQVVYEPLSVVQTRAGAIYKKLGRPNASISAEEINTLITYDAGLLRAQFVKNGMDLDWNSALSWATERVMASLRSTHQYRSNTDFQKTLNDWERAWKQNLQRRQQGQGTTTQRQGQGGQGAQGQRRQGGQGGQGGQRTAPTTTQADIPRGRIGREP